MDLGLTDGNNPKESISLERFIRIFINKQYSFDIYTSLKSML
ncbi:hypothetical protein [Tissierella pigra]|nr:hypothetical protein [Tissierella pigra]